MEKTQYVKNIVILAPNLFMKDFLIDYYDDFFISSYSNETSTLSMLNSTILEFDKIPFTQTPY